MTRENISVWTYPSVTRMTTKESVDTLKYVPQQASGLNTWLVKQFVGTAIRSNRHERLCDERYGHERVVKVHIIRRQPSPYNDLLMYLDMSQYHWWTPS